MPVKLSTTISKIELLSNSVNSSLISDLYDYMKKNGLSESHINNTLKTNMLFSEFLGENVSFYDVQRKDQIINFLDSKMKNPEIDPDKKWISTWNDYLGDIKYFFRWLNNYKLIEENRIKPVSEWETPSFAKIKKKKTKRLSPYLESEIWDREELELIIKYEKLKRNKAAIAMMWDLDARNHEITLLKIKHLRLKEKYGEGEVPHQAKTGSGPFLLTFSFPYVRDWLNEHPFRNEPDARLFCNLYNGGQIRPDALWSMMKNLKNRITRLIETNAIKNKGEKEKLELILKTKKFNPYCLRHSSITNDSDYLPEYALKKKCRWSMNSRQGNRYIKSRMGNDLKQKILTYNGIAPPKEMKKKPAVLECPRCELINTVENKYCSKCCYPLIPSAFEEIKLEEDMKINSLTEKYEKQIKELRQEMENKFNQIFEKVDVVKLSYVDS
jgi:integrase/recombinase XerD